MRRIAGIVLAAGGSTRLGKPKQLVELHREPLVHAAVRAALEGGCDVVCVVTGHVREAVDNAVADLGPMLIHNADWLRGLGSSVRLGVSTVQPASAVVLLVCDQPAVNGETVRSLIGLYDNTGQPIVASRYAGAVGVPALFDHSCFSELYALPDDQGARAVIQADPHRVAAFDFPDGALDIDSPEDLRAWMRTGT
jgi:molybdenum cofactor cytidylyltransferase